MRMRGVRKVPSCSHSGPKMARSTLGPNEASAPRMGAALERVMATPRTAIMAASVTMNELTPKRTTKTPLMMPTSPPAMMPTKAAGTGPMSPCRPRATTPLSARTEPSERSSWPERMTMVTPDRHDAFDGGASQHVAQRRDAADVGDEDEGDDEGDGQEDVDAVLGDEAQRPRVDGDHRRNLRSSRTALDDERTLDDVLGFGGDAEQDHEVVEDAHDEHADDGARHRAGATEDAVAADGHRRDGVELLAQAGVGTGALVDRGQQDAADGGEGGADDEDGDHHAADRDAGSAGSRRSCRRSG